MLSTLLLDASIDFHLLCDCAKVKRTVKLGGFFSLTEFQDGLEFVMLAYQLSNIGPRLELECYCKSISEVTVRELHELSGI